MSAFIPRLALGLAIGLCATGAARAQTAQGELVVTVVDADTKTPLDGAEVFLVGPAQTSALTNKSGILRFQDVPSGLYRVKVQRRGYKAASLSDFEVADGRRTSVSVALLADLRTVGHVTAQSSASARIGDIDENSALRRISDSLTDALNQVAGVSIDQSLNGDGSVTISLRGFDASQTGIRIAGVAIIGSSQGTVLRAVGSDLFSGSSVNFNGSAESLAGQVNFNVLEPTKTWITRMSSAYSTFDRSYEVGSITGSAGKLGIAAQFAHRSTGSPFDGALYEDQSGETFAHDGAARWTGEMLRLRYALDSRTTLTAGGILTNRGDSWNCVVFTQELPCGYGAGMWDHDQFALGTAGVQSLIGNLAVKLSAAAYGGTSIANREAAVIQGVATPSQDIYQYNSSSLSAALNLTVRRHSLALTYDTVRDNEVYTPVTLLFSGNARYLEHISSLNLSDTYKIGTRLAARGGFSLADANGPGASLLESAGLNWQPSKVDTFDVGAQFGAAQPPGTGAATFYEPSLVPFVCGGINRVGGPGDAATKQSSTSYNASWTHTWRGGTFTATAYRSEQSGVNFYGGVPIGNEPPGYLPLGYLAALQQAWNRPGSCAGVPFDPNAFYVVENVAGTRRRYEGFTLSGRVPLGHNVMLIPNYSTAAATLLSADARFSSPYAFIFPREQLPQRALHTGSVVVDVTQPHAALEWIGNAQFVGPNNGRGLNAYTQVNLGVSRALSRGTLTFFVSNVFNMDAGMFFTTQNSYRLPQLGGGSLPQRAAPLTPRLYNVLYAVKTNRKP